jgi:predicted nucleotidyltransferase
MSNTNPISASFDAILARTKLSPTDDAAFDRHQRQIEASLSSFEIAKFERIGSYVRGSTIKNHSDLDLLVNVRHSEVTWGDSIVRPTTLLDRMRKALTKTFPNTELGRDGQALVIAFADGRSVDVVPAVWREHVPEKGPLYWIPGADNDWLETVPHAQNKYINDGDTASGGKLKSVVRILKYWRHCRTPALALSGFHLELLLTQEGICNGPKTHAQCVADAFALLARRDCRALQDPCGVSGLISAAGTHAKLAALNAAVQHSATRARDAVACEQRGDFASARECWDLVFNREFSR